MRANPEMCIRDRGQLVNGGIRLGAVVDHDFQIAQNASQNA